MKLPLPPKKLLYLYKKCLYFCPWSAMPVYGQTGTHEHEKWLSLGTMRPAAGSEVLFVNQSSIPVSRHWATQPSRSLDRTAPCSSPIKRYDGKDCLPNKPHCPQQVISISPPSPSPKIKVYTSTKCLYFWLKDVVLSFLIYVDLLVSPFVWTVRCSTLKCQFCKGSEGRTYLEPLLQPCDWLGPTLSIILRHSSRVEKLRTTSKIFRACS